MAEIKLNSTAEVMRSSTLNYTLTYMCRPNIFNYIRIKYKLLKNKPFNCLILNFYLIDR